uniref:HDC07864 n=1 Tax=Drosophila melanogaster TaxID=7227 RepID=Q6IM08_DROME|nr:TPA_inf: HDC07864 [Drosophila melanogaster]
MGGAGGVGGRWSGVGGQATEDTGHWTLATCNARENLASGAPGTRNRQPGSQVPRTSSSYSPANNPRYSCAV